MDRPLGGTLRRLQSDSLLYQLPDIIPRVETGGRTHKSHVRTISRS